MSLWWNRRRVEAGVLGELSAEAEQKLFAHLRTCAACRAHYDTLSMGMDALSTSARDGRERARVLRPAVPGASPSTSRPVFVIPIAVALAATVLVVVNLRPAANDDDITLRGGAEEDGGRADVALLAYARRGDGPVRLAADFPLGGGSVARDERVQFFVRHAWPAAHVTVVGVGPDGTSRTLAEADVGASADRSSAVGVPLDVSSLAAGRWKLEATLVGGGSAPVVVRGTLELKP
jgi:hypothetical protein